MFQIERKKRIGDADSCHAELLLAGEKDGKASCAKINANSGYRICNCS